MRRESANSTSEGFRKESRRVDEQASNDDRKVDGAGNESSSTKYNKQLAGRNESARIEPKSRAGTLRSKIGACYQSLSGILATLIAVLFVSLLFFFQSVTSFLSRK